MPNNSQDSSRSVNPLADRVRARVAEAALTLKPGSRKPGARKLAQRPTLQTPDRTRENRETRSLRRVFKELAVTHREYRVRTGQRASPALRDAARAFKQTPSLPSLVVVAAFLDEDGLLAW